MESTNDNNELHSREELENNELYKLFTSGLDPDEFGKKLFEYIQRNKANMKISMGIITDKGEKIPIDEASISFIKTDESGEVVSKRTTWLHDGMTEEIFEEPDGRKYRLDENGNKIYFFEGELIESTSLENQSTNQEVKPPVRKRTSDHNRNDSESK